MNPLFIIRNFVKGILKEKDPRSVGLAFAFGFMLGLIPKNNLTAQLIFIFALIFKINIPFFFLSTILFSYLSFMTDKLTDPIGYFILTNKAFENIFVWMYNAPIIPWSDFNNTVVMGGFIVGIVLFYPIYFFSKRIAERYFLDLAKKLAENRVVKLLKISWLFDWYFKD